MPAMLKYLAITSLILTNLIQFSVLDHTFCTVCVINEDCEPDQCCYAEPGHAPPFAGHCVLGGTEGFPCYLGNASSPFCKCQSKFQCAKIEGDELFGRCKTYGGVETFSIGT